MSIIDMPRAEETIWWRGKKGFEVQFLLVTGNFPTNE